MTVQPCSMIEREAALLAPYAMHSCDTQGRRYGEAPHPYRGPYQRDRDRIVHCSAFRRLAHKTQVFTGDMGDYHRTRLTHTLEVASIARTIGRTLRLNEDLIEALALLHDIGHPPFGHAGEDVLDECLADCGGFGHNRQAVRIAEQIELRYPNFPGLNLSAEVLNGQRARADDRSAGRLLEVQVVDAADSIAYDAHDADDAVELGLLAADELEETELWRIAGRTARRRYAALEGEQRRRATVHALIDALTSDVIQSTVARLDSRRFSQAVDVVRSAEPLAKPSAETAARKRQLEDFLFERVYRHPELLRQRQRAGAALRALFDETAARPESLPQRYQELAETDGPRRAVADFLAQMTDRHAWNQFSRLPR